MVRSTSGYVPQKARVGQFDLGESNCFATIPTLARALCQHTDLGVLGAASSTCGLYGRVYLALLLRLEVWTEK